MVYAGVQFRAILIITACIGAWGSMQISGNSSVANSDGSSDGPLVCFIVRTFSGHDDFGHPHAIHSLSLLLTTLQFQNDPRWEAQVVVLDTQPFDNLLPVIQRLQDNRIQIFAEWVDEDYTAKDVDGSWRNEYHVTLYNLTDLAIRLGCSASTKWVVVTNGDNAFSPEWVSAVIAAPEGADVVTTDYYSRYQRPTAPPCERFAVGPGLPSCKPNEMRRCHMDVAAAAWRRSRLLTDGFRFGAVDAGGTGVVADGAMAEAVLTAGWKVHHLKDRCMLHHSPNPQLCALAGMVWDDSEMDMTRNMGGVCRNAEEVYAMIGDDLDKYEVLTVNATFDRWSFAMADTKELLVQCVRRRDPHSWMNLEVYGRICAASVDYHTLPDDMPAHAWDAYVPVDHLPLLQASASQPFY